MYHIKPYDVKIDTDEFKFSYGMMMIIMVDISQLRYITIHPYINVFKVRSG